MEKQTLKTKFFTVLWQNGVKELLYGHTFEEGIKNAGYFKGDFERKFLFAAYEGDRLDDFKFTEGKWSDLTGKNFK